MLSSSTNMTTATHASTTTSNYLSISSASGSQLEWRQEPQKHDLTQSVQQYYV